MDLSDYMRQDDSRYYLPEMYLGAYSDDMEKKLDSLGLEYFRGGVSSHNESGAVTFENRESKNYYGNLKSFVSIYKNELDRIMKNNGNSLKDALLAFTEYIENAASKKHYKKDAAGLHIKECIKSNAEPIIRVLNQNPEKWEGLLKYVTDSIITTLISNLLLRTLKGCGSFAKRNGVRKNENFKSIPEDLKMQINSWKYTESMLSLLRLNCVVIGIVTTDKKWELIEKDLKSAVFDIKAENKTEEDRSLVENIANKLLTPLEVQPGS